MANEPVTTITGNLTADPELRFTPAGRPVASFTIANTPRFPDSGTGQWKDGETWFVPCSAWGDMAENVITSLTKGAAVVASGRLRCRTWQTDAGEKRARVELTVDEIGPSLRRNVAKVTKVTRERPGSDADQALATATVPAASQPAAAADPWAASDEPPF
jgi:single-strand DNA-binding protein